MSSRKSGSIPLDKNYLFLNTKGYCLLCYDECPVQTLEKRNETTQTSVNFTRLVSRYLDFSIDNVIAPPLKRVGRKCVIDKDHQNGKKIDKLGFELCSKCEALAHAFCEVQFKIDFHQMILEQCVRNISEIIRDANKKSTADLFTLSEDDGSIKRQQKTFTRLTLGGLRSASMLRNKLYKRSLQKLSKSFPIIKLKRISKSGDWIPFLNKQDNKDMSKTLPTDSKDVIFSSLLGCVVSFWIVLSLSFINPQEYAQRVKEEKSRPKPKMLVPMPIINCDELEIELKFPTKKTSAPQEILSPPPKRSRGRPPSSSSLAQQRNRAQKPHQPVVIHKHLNQIVQIQRPPSSGSQNLPPQRGTTNKMGEMEHFQSEPASVSHKPKSTQYPTTHHHQPIPSTPPPKTTLYSPTPRVSGTASPQTLAHPAPQYPLQSQFPAPTPPLQTSPSFAASSSSHTPYNAAAYTSYPSSTSSSSLLANPINNSSTSSSAFQHYHNHQQYSTPLNNSQNTGSNGYNYSYNFNTYNYNSSSSWPPSYNSAPIDSAPSAPYVNGGYDGSFNNNAHETGRSDLHEPVGYNYGYEYSNYVQPSQPSPSSHYHQQQQQTGSNQYMPHSVDNMRGRDDDNIYSTGGAGGNGYNNENSESTSYTTLLPAKPKSSFYAEGVSSSSAPPISMDVDTTNTSTSDEPSLTHEDPQSLDSESSSMNGEDQIVDNGVDNSSGGQQPPLMFPEIHWRQQVGTSPPIPCKLSGCTEQFLTQAQLQLHMRAHGEFQCSFCHLTFSKAHNLAHHEKMGHCQSVGLGNRSKCPRCDFISTSQSKYFLHFLADHLRIAIYDKPCQICNKPFILGTKSINRRNHFRFYHDAVGKDPTTIFTCTGCQAQFLKEAQLRDHKPNCTSIASVSSSTSSVEEITYNTALATADQITV